MASSRIGWRVGFVASAAALSVPLMGAAAFAAPACSTHSTAGNAGTFGTATDKQPLSHADLNPGGANNGGNCGAYCSTRDGSPSANGNGSSPAGKPCAGCVGRADNKNPKGQGPDGSDHNNGYECDGNRGIGQGNPAHTSCTPTSIPVAVPSTPPVTPKAPVPPVLPAQPVAPAAPVIPAIPAAPAVPAAPAAPAADVAPVHAAGAGSAAAAVKAPAAPAAPARPVVRAPQSQVAPATVTKAQPVTRVLGVKVTRSAPTVADAAPTVAATSTALPFTGAHTTALVLMALLALGTGLAFIVVGRSARR